MILTREGKEIVAIYKQDGNEVDEVKDANGRLVYTNTREITGTLPLSFTSRGKPLADYRISGNTMQDGTPTPESPVDVTGCGVRTENLVNPSTIILNSNISHLGRVESDANYDVGCFQIIQGNTYTIDSYVHAFYNTIPTEGSVAYDRQRVVGELGRPSSFTAPITGYCCFRVDSGDSFMANHGAVALPYEPYGYKLPLTINGTEYPIYLGEVPTTRRIKKLVLTGGENVTDIGEFYNCGVSISSTAWSAVRSTTGGFIVSNNGRMLWATKSYFSEFETAADFKAYLAQQYSNGTPVTIWYVLAEQETAVVNEPLMKIGNYADTITMAQAGVTIPTVSGTNVLDTTTPVKPSEVYIKGKGIRAIT